MIKKVLISQKRMHLIVGVLLSAFVCLQAIHAESNWEDAQELHDQTDSKTDSEASISLPQTIPNSASQINLGFDSYLLDEVTFQEENNQKTTPSELVTPRIHKAIRILLKRIVTPNAP